MLKKLTFTAVLSMAFAGSAYAQIGLEGFSGEASISGGKTTGNTDTEDLALGIKLEKESDKWRHKVDALVDYGKVDGEKSKNRWALGYQIDRDLNDRTYVYGSADYYQDGISTSSFKDGYFIGGGLGYKAILPDPIGWNLEAGPGYRSQKARLPINDVDLSPNGEASVRQNEFAVRGASDFDYAINDNVSLYNDTEVIWSDSDTYIWNEVGLNAQLMGNLAARVSYRVDHHTDPLSGKKTDTATRFGVVYTIK